MKKLFNEFSKLDWFVFVGLALNVILSIYPNWNFGEFFGWMVALCFWYEARCYEYASRHLIAVVKSK